MLPAILYLLVNNYLPMAGIIMAFKKINLSMGLLKSPWCGFENFKFLFTTNTILLITRNTVLYNVAFILLDTVIGVSVAIFLNEVRSKAAQRLYQSLMLIPCRKDQSKPPIKGFKASMELLLKALL